MRAVQITIIGLILALVVAGVGLGLFRQVNGGNLRALVGENSALKKEAVSIKKSLDGLNRSLAQRDKYIDKLESELERSLADNAMRFKNFDAAVRGLNTQLGDSSERIDIVEAGIDRLIATSNEREARIKELEAVSRNGGLSREASGR